jgi:acetyltransferase-like isoleucine patch superfamily enzyme
MDKLLDRFRAPSITGQAFVTGLDDIAGIYPSTIISVGAGEKGEYVALGRGVYLGRRVELEAGRIAIGDDTSLQDGCAVRGDVRIGAHCLLGHNVLVIASTHRFMDNPPWLIRDQDAVYGARSATAAGGAAIRIDDDCWFGWSCAVMPGVHIGRGAVLAANSVITNNVGPYEIHGGIPNRKLGERLDFAPPLSINALDDACLPYFYDGFYQLRAMLKKSREMGLIFARGKAALVLAGLVSPKVTLKGKRLNPMGELRLRFWLNGVDAGCHAIPPGPFSLVLGVEAGLGVTRAVPQGLLTCTFLEWQEEAAATVNEPNPRYGISSAEIL